MPSRYIATAADIATVREQIQQLPQAAGICFREDTQSVVLIDPATGDEITLGTFSGDPGDITVAEDEIIIGQVGDVGASTAISGDATLIADGTVTVVGINGAAITGDGADVQALLDDSAGILAASTLVAAIPTANVASPLIWNDGGALTLGTL